MTKKKSTKKTPPAKPDRKIELQLRHQFTQKETLEIAKKMAEANRDLALALEEKKAITTQLKAKCEGIASRVAEAAGKINSGFEYRLTSVTVKYHTPKTGAKRLIRDDTGEILEEEAMSQAELQDELPLNLSPEPFNAVLKGKDAERVTSSPGVVAVPADESVRQATEED